MAVEPSRREVLKLAVATAALGGLPLGNQASTNPKRTPKALFQHSVCRWCYPKIPLAQLATAVKPLGISSIELLNPEEWPLVRDAGLTCAVANGTTTIPKGLNRPAHHVVYVPTMLERIAWCAKEGIPNVICFSGNREGQADEEGLEHCTTALKQLVGEAERRGVTILMELLNSKLNHKDYQCDHTAWGVELVKRVGSERFKLLYDIYHMQIMEGDIIATIRAHHNCIGHYHTAGCPGRNELDGDQELQYPAIMRAIAETGFTGYVAQEFLPKREPLTSLAEAVALCSV